LGKCSIPISLEILAILTESFLDFTPGKFCDSASIRLLPLPPTFFPIHHPSSYLPKLYSLDQRETKLKIIQEPLPPLPLQIRAKKTKNQTKINLKAAPYLKRLVAGFPPRRPGFDPRSGRVGFVVDKAALEQVFSEYCGFPCQSSFYQLLHNHHHLSSGAGTIGQQWPTYQVDSVSPHPEKINSKI
jgi:hypothetical protein